MGKRGEKRIDALHPVRLWGMDAAGRPFIEATYTVNVSQKGTLLKGVSRKLALGDIVGLTHEDKKAKFRVVWVGQDGTSEAGSVGLQSLEFGKSIWNVNIADALDHYSRPPEQNRCQARRLKCGLSAEVYANHGQGPIWVTLGDVSTGGCYVLMMLPLKLQSTVRIGIWLNAETKIWAEGVVISAHAGFGMGIKFVRQSRSDRTALDAFLELSAKPSVSAASAKRK